MNYTLVMDLINQLGEMNEYNVNGDQNVHDDTPENQEFTLIDSTNT